MKRNVSVVHLIFATWSSGLPASQPVSCLTCLSADLSVNWLRMPTQFSKFPYLGKWKSQCDTWRTPSFREDWCFVWDVPAANNWSKPLWCNLHNSCIYGNLQHLCKSTGRWGTFNWIFPAEWSDIPHFTCQHGWNSVLYMQPCHLKGTLATALVQSDAAWLILIIEISERESLPKQTTNHRCLESTHHWRNSGSDSGCNGTDFPKYGALGSILSGRKWWPLTAHVMMMSHFLHNEVSPLQILLQYPY